MPGGKKSFGALTLAAAIFLLVYATHSLAQSDVRAQAPFQVISVGSNSHGELGLGTFQPTSVPAVCPKGPFNAVRAFAAGHRSAVLTTEGKTYFWGSSWLKDLTVPGDGSFNAYYASTATTIDVPNPTLLSAMGSNIIAHVAIGLNHLLVSTDKGVIFAQGQNRFGQLGTGDLNDRDNFQQVADFSDSLVVDLKTSLQNSAAVLGNGKLYMWGENSYGQMGLDSEELGTASRGIFRIPTYVQTLEKYFIVAVSLGTQFTVVLDVHGNILVHGRNDLGQLGLGHYNPAPSPTLISQVRNIAAIACGLQHTVIMNQSGVVFSTGSNSAGQLGLGDQIQRNSFSVLKFEPQVVCDTTESSLLQDNIRGYVCLGERYPLPSTRARSIAAGSHHSIVITDDGSVWSFGLNSNGQLGLGHAPQTDFVISPQLILNLYGANTTSSAGGDSHSILRSNFQHLTIHEVSPRMLYSSSTQSVQLWMYGIGFNDLRHHQFFCIFRGNSSSNQDVNISLEGSVFSNFRASCLFSYDKVSKLGKSSAELERIQGAYTLTILVQGASAAPAFSTFPPPFLSETSDFLTAPIISKTYYILNDCPSNCSSYCSSLSSSCLPGIISSIPQSGSAEGGTRVTVIGFGFHREFADDVRCRYGDASQGTSLWSAGEIINSTHLVCTSVFAAGAQDRASSMSFTIFLRVSLNGQTYSTTFAPFLVYPNPILLYSSIPFDLAVDPDYARNKEASYGGPAEGGTMVDIYGSSMQAAMLKEAVCTFLNVSVPATLVASDRVRCTSPSWSRVSSEALNKSRTIPLQVRLNGQEDAKTFVTYTYYVNPEVRQVYPEKVPLLRSASLHLIGRGFLNFQWYPRCQVGELNSIAAVISDEEVVCFSGVVKEPKAAMVKFYPNAQDASGELSSLREQQNRSCAMVSSNSTLAPSVSCIFIEYFPPNEVSYLSITSGPLVGGTMITVFGAGFLATKETPKIRFRCSPANLVHQNSSSVFSVFYGNVIFKVWFDSDRVVTALVASDTELVCTSPAMSCQGVSSLSYAANGEDFLESPEESNQTLSAPFLFYPLPLPLNVLPQAGPVAGNTSITITGTSFFSQSQQSFCRFVPASQQTKDVVNLNNMSSNVWQTSVQGTIINNTALSCRTPKVDTPVMVVVSISFNDQNFHLVEQDRFTFYQNPILVLLYPAGGPNVGGTSVTIFGQGLQSFGIGRMYCSFGTNVVRTTTNSSTQDQIVCSSPHSPSSGIALVSVSLNGQDFTGALFFDYYMLPALSALSPMGGPPIRDPQLYTSVTISGSGFSSFHGSALCRFGCSVTPATVQDDSTMLCKAPWPGRDFNLFRDGCRPSIYISSCRFSQCDADGCRLVQHDTVDNITCVLDLLVQVSLNGFDFSLDQTLNFRYYQQPNIVRFGPTGGPEGGNTLIELFTDGAGGFQRLNDGSFTLDINGRTVVCEQVAGDTVLEDDFDPTPQEIAPTEAQLNQFASSELDPAIIYEQVLAENRRNYLYDKTLWVSGDGLITDRECGGSPQEGMVKAALLGGNIQGFGARVTNVSDISSSLRFTGAAGDPLVGRYLLSVPVDISRGAEIDFFLRKGYATWPSVCETPDAQDDLLLYLKSEASGASSLRPPIWNERPRWQLLDDFIPASTRAAEEEFIHVVKEVGNFRRGVAKSAVEQEMVTCIKNLPCNKSLASVLLVQPIYGRGSFDNWAVDNFQIIAKGGVTSDSRAVCRSPPSDRPMLADVRAALNGQQFFPAGAENPSNLGKFVYYQQPTIYEIVPSGGPAEGGSTVTINGKGFFNFRDSSYPAMCKFGIGISDAEVLSDSRILCPKVKDTAYAGYAEVLIALNGRDFSYNSPSRFIYYNEPVLQEVFPNSGPAQGGSQLYVTGSGFLTLSPYPTVCKFSAVNNPSVYFVGPSVTKNDSLIVCLSPNVSSVLQDDELTLEVTIEVSLNGNQFTSYDKLFFSFFQDALLVKAVQVTPGRQTIQNFGDPITVYGKRLRKDKGLKCVHRSDACQQTNCTAGLFVTSLYMRSEKMYCSAPSFPGQPISTTRRISTKDLLLLSMNGIDIGEQSSEFFYYSPAQPTQVVIPVAIGGIVILIIGLREWRRRSQKSRRVVETQARWDRPSIDAAISHMHAVGIRKPGTTRKYNWRSTTCEDLAQFGEGVGLYFKFLKHFGQTFTIISGFAVTSIILNNAGVSYSSKKISASALLLSTIGNIGGPEDGQGNIVLLQINQYNIFIDIPKAWASVILASIDTGIVLIFYISYMHWLNVQNKVSKEADSDHCTCSDYSIIVDNVPQDATDKQEWQDFFYKLNPIQEHGGEISNISIALNNGKLLQLSHEREKLEKQLDALKAKFGKTHFADYQEKIKKVERKLRKLIQNMGAMRSRVDFKAVVVFVTFESEVTRQEVEDEFKGILPKKHTLFRNRYRLKVHRAPDPDVILWENLQSKGLESRVRLLLVLFVTIFLLLCSSATIVLLLSAKKSLEMEGFPAFCADAPNPSDPNVQEQIMWLLYSDGRAVYQSYLKCYCANCAVGCGNKVNTEPAFCQEYLTNERNLLLLTLISAVGPSAINAGLTTVLKVLVEFERKHSSNERDASLARSVFFAQFVNTALISLIVNADITYYISALSLLGKDGLGLLTGDFRDLTSRWYMVVGIAFIPTVLTASLSPNFGQFAKWPATLIKQRIAKTNALTQKEIDEIFAGPSLQLSERYGAMLNITFVIFMYSSGMPILYFFGILYYSTAYWSDKITLLEVFQRPGSIDSTLVKLASNFFQWAVYLHLSYSCWSFGQLYSFQLYVPVITEVATRGKLSVKPGERIGFIAMVAERLQNAPALIPFLLLLAIMARDIIVAFLGPAYRHLLDMYRRRQRVRERRKLREMRKRAGYDSETSDDEEEDDEMMAAVNVGSQLKYSEALEYSLLQGIESYDILKNPKYRNIFSDAEYIPQADSSSDSELSEGSWGDDADELQRQKEEDEIS